MSKTNYTKVEEALAEGLRKITAERLLGLADDASGNSKKATSHVDNALLITLRLELTSLIKKNEDPYKLFAINKDELKNFMDHPETITLKDWENIKKLKVRVDQYKKAIDKIATNSDDAIIEQARNKHVNKRYNVKDTWLPLH